MENQELSELKELIQRLEQRIRVLETKPVVIEKKEFIDVFDILKCRKYIFDTFYSQDAEPTIAMNSFAFWFDTNAPAYYLLFNFKGTQKKVALT